MNDDLARAYDRTPYPDYAFWRTHPDYTGMFGRLFGLDTAPPERCRVLEIGCAVGGNIIPMAALAPGSHFVGVDLSGVQITRAITAARDADVRNIVFMHGDFGEVPAHLGPFDYIICHGVFAWVEPATQDALLRFIGERLAPQGVAFVSYNTYPGHHMVDMVRKLLTMHTARAPDLVTKGQQALAILRFLHRRGSHSDGDWRSEFIRLEIEVLQALGLDMLEHDYCAVVSHPVYFSDFVERAAKAKLEYLGDTLPWDMYLDNQHPEVVAALEPLGDVVKQGQYIDFLRNARFRETLLCRADATLSRNVPNERVMGFHVGHALSEDPTLDGLKEQLPIQLRVGGAPIFSVSHPIIRVALHRLWLSGRRVPAFADLADEVAAELRAHGFADGEAASFREQLAAQLLRSFFANVVRFALRDVPLARQVPERPATGRYQRAMARARRPRIINLAHETLMANDEMYALLPLMDGSLTVEELAQQTQLPARETLRELCRRGYVLDPSALHLA